MATYLSGLNGAASQIIHTSLKHIKGQKPKTTATCQACTNSGQPDSTNLTTSSVRISLQASRRASLGFSAIVLLHHFSTGTAHASWKEPENNGWWVTEFPLPVPTITNKIANEATGTRSFLRNGIFRADIGTQNIPLRLKHYAFDLLALGDLLGQNASNYVRKYLCLKATVMYYDFDDLISAAPNEQKQPLTDLANRLFDSAEMLEEAVKKKDDPMISSVYADTKAILQEVMAKMA